VTALSKPEHPGHQAARERCAATKARNAQQRIENVSFLLSWGTPVWEIPARVGTNLAALERFLYRHDRKDLIAEMRRQDPGTMNQLAPHRRRRSNA
jgi:hypothetical protein